MNQQRVKSLDFWHLWGQHQAYLSKRCLSWMGGNSMDAKEALSQATVKAWDKWQNSAKEITNFKAWATRLTHNLCMDMHRKRAREARGIERLGKIALAEDEYIASHVPAPESALLDRERGRYMRHAIESLPAQVRIPFILRYDQEMSYSDIAQQLAISNDSARKRVQQARTILKKQLNKYFSEWDSSSVSAIGLNSPLKGEVRTQESSESDFSLGRQPFNHKATQLALEKLISEPITTSGCKRQITTGCTTQSIDYKVTATCLEVLSHTRYSSPSCLRWR